jgi:hypothetical protein
VGKDAATTGQEDGQLFLRRQILQPAAQLNLVGPLLRGQER